MVGKDKEPRTKLQPEFSDQNAASTPWAEALARLEQAELYWLTTVRLDGRPHVTPLIAVWLDGALYFCTGESERKAKNLAHNLQCVITTGCNALNEGLDIVVEGKAAEVRDESRLQRVADAFTLKYPPREGTKIWRFAVRDGIFYVDNGECLLYEVTPAKVFGFGKGRFSQTRWRL